MLLDKTRTVKIADFGVARVEASNPNDMTGETGTLGYMAPEVFGFTGTFSLHVLLFLFLFLRYKKKNLLPNSTETCLANHTMHGLQVLNGNPYNRKCDVYSFGICLWEIYCCDMPYPDLSFSEVTSAVVRQVHYIFFHPTTLLFHYHRLSCRNKH